MKSVRFRRSTDEIKKRVNIVEIVDQYTKLIGRKKGLCPFHKDTHPSFFVYEQDQHYHCFGCGAHGDVVDFLQRIQKKSFRQVINDLRKEVGMTPPTRITKKNQQHRKGQT